MAVLLLIVPGAFLARAGGLRWPIAVAAGPALTYGVVGIAIMVYGAVGVPWNALTALFALAVFAVLAWSLRKPLGRFQDPAADAQRVALRPALLVAAGVLIGAALIAWAAVAGLPQWQSIPSNWDSVWHANTVRFILETGQASPTHMGELRNVETHDPLYYPSTFHALAAVLAQLVGAAPTSAYTLSALAASVWLFPASAAVLTWHLARDRTDVWRAAGCAATAAALSASFTSVPYVEFTTASMPNLAAYGIAVPAMALTVSALAHRDRIPLAVVAIVGVFSVHTTGGIVTVLFLAAWWACHGVWRPVRSRGQDLAALLAVGAPALVILLPQFVGILRQAEIIAGHAFVTGEGKKRALIDAAVQHTRHLNDFPIQWALIVAAAAGAVVLVAKRVWWPLAVWALLVVAIVHSSAPVHGAVGRVIGLFSDTFYSDPRRLSAVVTMLLTSAAGIALFAVVGGGVRLLTRRKADPRWGAGITAAVLAAVCVGAAWHYLPVHRHLFGEKYDAVIIDDDDLAAMAYLAQLPGARDTLIGNANTDGTAWMYAVAGLHPLWTHYDYPVQQGPGYHRFVFWAYADDADTDPRIAAAVHALNIRYVLVSKPVVRGFVMPDGLVSLDSSRSWKKIYDNGGARIYEWRGDAAGNR